MKREKEAIVIELSRMSPTPGVVVESNKLNLLYYASMLWKPCLRTCQHCSLFFVSRVDMLALREARLASNEHGWMHESFQSRNL